MRSSCISALTGPLRAARAAWLALLLAVAATSGALAQAPEPRIHAVQIDASAEVLRVVVEANVGAIVGVTTLRGPEPALRVELKDVPQAEVAALVARLERPKSFVRDVRVEPGLDGRILLFVRLSKQMRVIGETVLAVPRNRSRWGVELAEDRSAPAPAPARPAAAPVRLDRLSFASDNDRIDLILDGSASLEAEVSMESRPPALIVDFPGLALRGLETALAAATADLPAALRQAKAMPGPDRSARLRFDLRDDIDQIDASGAMLGNRGRLTISLVPDAPPDARTGREQRITAIEAIDNGGEIQVEIANAGSARISSFGLADPPRLVIDLLGMTPAQAQQAVRAFRSAHPVIRQAALTETRLGSARIVFALSSPISVAPGSGIGSVPGRPDRRVVALRAPEKAAPSETQFAGVPGLDLRVHRVPRDDERGPAIRAVDLGSVRNAAATPAGRRFSLVDMLETALERDPRYAASRAESRAIEETVVQARADYLPVAAFDFQRSFVRYRTREAPNPTFPIGSVDYPGQGIGVTLTQPLFRLPALRRMDQAALSVEQSRLNVLASEQDLILRVATAYLNLLAATDARDLARAEREATGRELDLARTRQRSGLATPVQLYEVEARNALAEAREIEAGRAIEDARYAIKEIVGDEVASVRGLRRDFVAVPPVPSRVEDWVEAAMEQNLALQARSLATQIAQIEIERQRAGHYPTVDAVLSYNRTDDGGSLYGGAQRTDVGSAGVRVRVPLYEGGRTSSLVREALARHDRSLRERDEELRRTERVARAAFRTVNANINSMEALRKSVLAQGTALAARIEGYRSGVTSIVAVVDAYRLYFSAYRDYLQVRYDYLLNRLRLKQAVGTLSRNDLQDLTALLE